MSDILNAVTGRKKFFIQGDGVYSSITGAKIGIIENGVVKSSATGNAIAIVNSSSDDGGIDLSFITAGAKDILSGAVGADTAGNPVYGSISKKAAATYTPGTANQTIAAGLYLSGVQTIKGDSNLKAGNIKQGVSIFGVTGTSKPMSDINFDMVNASESDVREGIVFVDGSGKVATGTMPERGIVEVELTDKEQVLQSGHYTEIVIPAAPASTGGIKFYECASINSDYHAVAIDGQDWDLDTSAGGSNPGAFGVYYPVDLSVNPLQREYKRKDGAYKLSVIDEPDDETMARIAITRISDGVIICSTVPISKNDAIWDVWTGDYWGSMYQGTSVDEFDAEFPYYDARFISYGSGNFLTLSGAGVAAANGVYGRTDGSMDYESAGCAGAWVSEDGKAKLVLSFDWLWDDENDTELPCIYLRCEGKEVYNLPMPDIGWDYEIRSAADLEDYTWVVADDGATPTPVVADTDAPAPAWSGYKLTQNNETGEWVKATELTTGLEKKGYEPQVGKIYSADTTIELSRVLLETAGEMVALYHFDNTWDDATGKTTVTRNDYIYRFNTDAKKFGAAAATASSGAYLYSSLNKYYPRDNCMELTIKKLPELDAFTIEWWQRAGGTESNTLGDPVLNKADRLTVMFAPEVTVGNLFYADFHHVAFVRKAASSVVTMYIDGVAKGTTTFEGSLGGDNISFYGLTRKGSSWSAFIDELAIFNYAKYDGDFEVPTAPYEVV